MLRVREGAELPIHRLGCCEQSRKQCAANWRKRRTLGAGAARRASLLPFICGAAATSETFLPPFKTVRRLSTEVARISDSETELVPTAPLPSFRRKNQLQNLECVCSDPPFLSGWSGPEWVVNAIFIRGSPGPALPRSSLHTRNSRCRRT